MTSVERIGDGRGQIGRFGSGMDKLWLVAGALLLASATMAGPAVAAPGDLDPTFGSGGKVTTDFFGGFDEAEAVTVQPDGKIIAVGRTSDSTTGAQDFALARYDTDGSLDTSFGSSGRVITDFFADFDEAGDIALQPDGKIVVAGRSFDSATGDTSFALARYNPDGSLDSSFGSSGQVITDFFADFDEAGTVVVQSDGKIIAIGLAIVAATNNGVFALARYNSDGSLDPSFGSGGKVTTDFFGDLDLAEAGALQSDGKIIVAGRAFDPSTSDTDFALARYNPDGSLDTSFGSGGKVTTDFLGDFNEGDSITLQPDGKIVVAGFTVDNTGGDADFALARYNSDGSLDSSFGSSGKVITDLFGFFDQLEAVGLQSNGKIVATGKSIDSVTSAADFALVRYNSDGSLDVGFGVGGKVITDFVGDFDEAEALALQSDGKIVVAGKTFTPTTGDENFALARYFGDPVLTVVIDIKPGSDPNSINTKSKGKIPVAILSDATFSAPAEVDSSSLTFGSVGDEPSLSHCNINGEDVNGDQIPDLVCHFLTQLTGFQSGDTLGTLAGETISGESIKVTDSVRIKH